MRGQLALLLSSRRWEQFIIAVIIVNAITLGLETSPEVMAAIGPVLMGLDAIILTIFVVEIVLRLYAHGLKFFRDPWSIFDFAIVSIALIPASGPFTVLRALRILRVLRLISVVPSLRKVIGGLVASLPGIASIFVLLMLVFYVFAVMATKLYAASFPEWFGSIPASFYTLFQVMTLESWSMGIVRPVMEVHPTAWIFFVPFIGATAFTVLNLFIGVIVSAMQEEHDSEATTQRQELRGETELVLAEVRALRAEVAEMRKAQNPGG
ncbi:ion transporter [Pelagibacterium sp.]|uniref:ion transporter n=1 Tax=Pelagibacterium sp. TaxID=1967288 RepID=UPI003A8D9F8C